MKMDVRVPLSRVVTTCVLCVAATNAFGDKPAAGTAYQAFPSTLVTACKLPDKSRVVKYASDLNTLSALRAKGSILVYVLQLGSDGPPSQRVGDDLIYYNAFDLYLVNRLTGIKPSRQEREANGRAGKSNGIYESPAGTLFKIEWRASVTFDNDSGRGGYLEGQGGLLSNAEYADIIAYLQTQPFHLMNDWRGILSKSYHLPVCNIKWTATERYMSPRG